MEFTKCQGAGNDFILIDNRDGKVDRKVEELGIDLPTFVRKLCAFHTGVGADGLILIEEPESPENDFKWRFFNADGSVAEMCGNGSRCAVRFAYEKGIVKKEHVRFETLAGVIEAWIKEGGRVVKVQLTKPFGLKTDFEIPLADAKLTGHFLNTGVPHVVVYREDLETFDVKKFGSQIRYHEMFAPSGTNVNFIKTLGGDRIAIRTYERGVEDETLACGTGSTAAAIIAYLKGLVKEKPVKVHTKGGEVLVVDFDENLEKVYLEGKVYKVFDGTLSFEIFEE
ncbi:MAG: diaminopimelate epimerase [Aquificae bacterium]|nr:diaminopimelate epimerase [Aquificota bacterium]